LKYIDVSEVRSAVVRTIEAGRTADTSDYFNETRRYIPESCHLMVTEAVRTSETSIYFN
jgi:hypothetical protein